jgi:hypothetical protein
MDVRAFGSRYGFSAALPYASGFMVSAGTNKVFPACRALFVETSNKSADKTLIIELAEQQKGQLITTEKGVVYSFPHPAHVLTELTNNAQNWASSQHKELLEQVTLLQQRLTMLTIQQTAARSQPSGLLPQQELNNNKDTEYRIDPWNKLL